MKYKIDSDVRVIDNGANELRIRSGLWNYNEAVIDLAPYEEKTREATRELVQQLQGDGFAYDDIDSFNIKDEDKMELKGLLEGLLGAGMIYSREGGNLNDRITDAILGKIKESLVKEDFKSQEVLFISDCDFSIHQAKELCQEMKLQLGYEGIDFINKVAGYDVTTNFDALATEKGLSAIHEMIKGYDAMVISLKHTNMKFIRNMNRVALEYGKTMTVGMLDGPFVTVFSTRPPETGCAECFETRILARLEDHRLYDKYVQTDKSLDMKLNPSKVVLSSMLTSLLISEAFLLHTYSMTKFEGRVLSIFLPSLEIQTQDLLRVPYCPACGHVSRAQFEEMNIQSRVIVDDLLKEL